jgi:hypothetical protein
MKAINNLLDSHVVKVIENFLNKLMSLSIIYNHQKSEMP